MPKRTSRLEKFRYFIALRLSDKLKSPLHLTSLFTHQARKSITRIRNVIAYSYYSRDACIFINHGSKVKKPLSQGLTWWISLRNLHFVTGSLFLIMKFFLPIIWTSILMVVNLSIASPTQINNLQLEYLLIQKRSGDPKISFVKLTWSNAPALR